MIVIDASVVVHWLVSDQMGERAHARIAPHFGSLWAPHLLEIEVMHVIRRLVAKRSCSLKDGEAVLEDLVQLPIHRADHRFLLEDAWLLRKNLSIYDATYVALAGRLGCKLLTCDQRLANSPQTFAEVELLALAEAAAWG